MSITKVNQYRYVVYELKFNQICVTKEDTPDFCLSSGCEGVHHTRLPV